MVRHYNIENLTKFCHESHQSLFEEQLILYLNWFLMILRNLGEWKGFSAILWVQGSSNPEMGKKLFTIKKFNSFQQFVFTWLPHSCLWVIYKVNMCAMFISLICPMTFNTIFKLIYSMTFSTDYKLSTWLFNIIIFVQLIQRLRKFLSNTSTYRIKLSHQWKKCIIYIEVTCTSINKHYFHYLNVLILKL